MLFGVLAPLWMWAGVAWVAGQYPGYSHKEQVMSELGARARPTYFIQPLVNNHPIGVLFCLFGIGLWADAVDNSYGVTTGVLMLIQGGSHIVAGLFPCDADLGERNPSPAQKLHNLAGLVMYLSLLAACLLWVASPAVDVAWFRGYSLASALASIAMMVLMVRAFNGGGGLGLYQRASYGILAAWAAVLALVLLRT